MFHRISPSGAPRIALTTVVAVLALAPAAFADPALNPPPPSFETCRTVGQGTICEGTRTLPIGPMDINDEGGPSVTCGAGQNTFHIIDSAIVDQRATRYYDADGNLARRVSQGLWRSAQLANSVTGAALG